MLDPEIYYIVAANCRSVPELICKMRSELLAAIDAKGKAMQETLDKIEHYNKVSLDNAGIEYIKKRYQEKYEAAVNSKPFSSRDSEELKELMQDHFRYLEYFVFTRLAMELNAAMRWFDVYDQLVSDAIEASADIFELSESKPQHIKLGRHSDIEADLRKAMGKFISVFLPLDAKKGILKERTFRNEDNT